MTNQIKFKRSDVPGRVPTIDDIDPGELALNTFDGKLFTNQTQGAISRIIEIGGGAAQSVLYVSKSGNDDNDGKTLGTAKLTIKSALAIATPGTTVFVKSGEYIEENPLLVPARVAIIGDSLRTVTIRPANTDQDICWVNNGSYIFQLNFKGHVSPAAAVAFPPDGSAGYIVTSPYVQAVTSITTTGTGMRVDGSVVDGLKSMVVDAFTQYNQGGIGIHMLNRGNTQLVSVFTICCDISFLCEDGGFCSITNSNTSFGNYGLVSRGTSEPLYYGVTGETTSGRQFLVKNLEQRPNVGDGVLFADYNQQTCERDAGLIVDSLAFDLLYGGSTQSSFAGLRYWDRGLTQINGQETETTAALNYASSLIQDFFRGNTVTAHPNNTSVVVPTLTVTGTEHGARFITAEFDTIKNIITYGAAADVVITGPNIDIAEPEYRELRTQVLGQRAELIQGVTDYIAANFPTLEYDRATCERDMGLIVDAVVDDLAFGSNYKSIIAALSYVSATGGLYIPAEQLPATLGSINFLKTEVANIVNEDVNAVVLTNSRFDTIIDIMNGGNLPAYVFPTANTFLAGVADNLQQNKEFVVAETLVYMANNYPTFTFDTAVCARDIRYTIDALCYDLVYGGNSQTVRAGNRYFNYANGNSQLPLNEVEYTIAAFDYVQLTLQRVIINDPIPPAQIPVTYPQYLAGQAATTLESDFVGVSYSVIKNIILNGTQGSSGTIVPNGQARTDTVTLDGVQLLAETKDFVIADTIAWLEATYPSLVYNQATCIRDLGRIIDSVSFDLLHGGNRQSVQAGIYYYGSSTTDTIIQSQEVQSVGTLTFISELLEYIVTAVPSPKSWQTTVQQVLDLPPANASVLTQLRSNINLIKSIIEDGPDGATGIEKDAINLTPSTDIEVEKAFNLIVNNRDYIKAEVVAYANKNWSIISQGTDNFYVVAAVEPLQLGITSQTYPDLSLENAGLVAERQALLNAKDQIRVDTIAFLAAKYFDNFVFNKVKCYRDVGLILEAVLDDMALGSNYKTVIAGLSYYRYYTSEVVDNQLTQTLASLDAARDFTLARVLINEAKTIITENFQIIKDIIEFGPTAAPALVFPPTGASDIGNVDAGVVLQANKEFVKEEVIAWINSNLGPFTYDEVKCARDVGYIVDGLTYDLSTGSNYWAVVNGRSYLRANANAVLVEPQKTATLDAMEYVIDTVKDLITVDSNLQTVFDIVKYGTNSVPAISYPNNPTIDANRIAAKDQLQANKTFIQDEIIAYINFNNTELIYDPIKCARDVGYIVDAVSYDVMFDSNFRSIVSGLAYYRANAVDVVGAQKAATLDALNQLKTSIAATISTNSTAVSRANASMDIIIDIFDNGPSAAPAFNIPYPTNSTLGTQNAKLQLEENKAFIVDEIVSYINDTFVGFVYDAGVQAKCERDLDIIIDAASYDMALGTNYNAVTAGLAYQRANTTVVQEAQQYQTVAGIRYAQDRLNNGIADATSRTRFDAAVNEVIDILKNNTPDTLSFPAPSTAPPADVTANLTLQTNRSSIQTSIVTWIDSNFVGFTYDLATQTKCERDLGYIIDASKFDSALATNYNAVTAGLGYRRANAVNVQNNQLLQTTESIKFARDLSVANVGLSVQTAVGSAFDEVVDIILNNTPDVLTFGETGIAANRIAAKNALVTNRSLIQTQVISWLTTNYPSLTYDQVKCSRDVGYILDGLCYDLMYGGNSAAIRNADAYFVGATNQLGAGETTATLAAYDQLKIFVAAVIPDSALHTTASDLIDIIRAHISNGGTTNLSSILLNPSIVETNYASLNANKNSIIASTSQFILDNFNNFSYNSAACSRDVGYIIDALSHDILYGGNWATVRNADAYFVGTTSQLGAGESYVTVLGYGELQNILSTLVPAKSVELTNLVDIIKTVITDGNLTNLPAITYPSVAWVNPEIQNEFEAIQAAKTDAIADTSAYITTTFSNFTYDSVTCARDVGYIVDALIYDVTYQGNLESLVAGRSYYVGANAQFGTNEKTATLAAYDYLKQVVNSVVLAQAIANKYTTLVQDISTNGPGNTASANFTSARVQDIYDTIANDGQLPAEILPDTSWVAGGLVAAFNSLQAAKSTIQTDIISYIDNNFAYFTYNRDKCREDVGYIVDALTHDVMYEGNLATIKAAEAYFVGTQSQLGAGESSATIAAYQRLAVVAGEIVQGLPVTPTTGNTSVQSDGGGNATAVEAGEITDLITIINNVIQDGNLSSLPTIVYPTAVNTTTDYTTSIATLIAQKETIKSGTINFVNTKPRLVYDETLCRRDIGLILDAVTYDLAFGSNFRSIKAGQAYLRSYAKEVTVEPQRKAILNALETIQNQIALVSNADVTETAEIKNRIDIIVDIIKTLDGDRAYSIPAPVFRTEEAYTSSLIEQNREFLVLEVEQYLKNNYPKLKYDIVACRRDVNFIIDAIKYDITYGGNSQTINAGQAYYSGNTLYLGSGEKVPTLMAYAYLKTLVRDVATNTPVTALQNAVVQTTGMFSYTSIANVAADLIEDIRTIINAVDPVPAVINPTYNWGDAQYVAIKNAVDTNKSAIQDAVIADINSKVYFVYKEASCARDVGYIIDAINYDLVYGGNSQSIKAAKSYYDGKGRNVVASELNETVQALEYMKLVLQKVIRNRPVTPTTGNTEIQNVLLSPGSQASVVKVGDLVDYINAIIKEGVDRQPTIIEQDFSQADTVLNNVRLNLLSEKTTLQQQTLDYIESRLLTFNKDTCGRDVGLIIDAVAYDMIFDSNFQSVTAGNSYLRASASVVKQFQLGPTIASIDFIKDKCIEVVAINPTAVSRVAQKFTLIKQILVDGVAYTGEIVYPPPVGVTQGRLDAIAQIQANRNFIIEEVFEYIDQNYTYLYDEEKCRRDVGLILNAVLDDIIFDTNYRTVTAALSYLRSYAGTVTSRQKLKTIAGINKARDLAIAAIIDPVTQGQITDLFQIVTDVIESLNPATAPAVTFGNPVGVDADIVSAAATLRANKSSLAADVISWINSTYTGFIYDAAIQVKCERDVNYIVDAARIDAVLGTNYNSVTAGQAYQRANSAYVLAEQKPQTEASIAYAKKITGDVAANAGVKTAIAAAFDEVISGLNGELPTPIVFSAPTGVTPAKLYAKNNLVANKDFIKVEVSQWILQNLSGFDYTPAIQTKCERDLGYIIDAASYDMVLGTNYNSVTAGLGYLRANASVVNDTQKIQTIDSIKYAKTLAESEVTDITGLPRVTSAFNEVIDIIKNGTPDGLIYGNPSGVATEIANSKQALIDNKAAIQSAVALWLASPVNGYDTVWVNLGAEGQAKCTRDVGYIIDALVYDVLYGGNTAAIRNADAYWVGAVNQLGPDSNEVTATLAAYQQLKTIVAGYVDPTVIATTDSLIEIIRTHITNGGTTDFNAILVNPTITWATLSLQTEFSDLQTAKPTIISSTSTYILNTFDGFVYIGTKKTKCERDIGYIVDALCHDILYDGNYASVRVADSYFVGAVSQLGTGESVPTVYAYERLQEVVAQIVQGQTVTTSPGTNSLAVQTILPDVATATQALRLNDLIEITKTVILEGSLSNLATIEYPDVTWTPAAIETDFNNIGTNKASIVEQTSAFITRTFSNFVYDQAKCFRDVGYIVDAVGYDMMFDSNFRSITAALAYYRANASDVVGVQKEETLKALERLKVLISVNVDSNVTAKTRAESLMDIIIDIFANGPGAAPSVVISDPTTIDPDTITSRTELTTNKATIQSDVINYINDTFVTFNYGGAVQTTCERDLGIILDAASYDLELGTNYNAVTAGNSYRRANTALVYSDQLPQTVEGIRYAGTLTVAETANDAPVQAAFNEVINALNSGNASAITYPAATFTTANQISAKNLLQTNRTTLASNLITWINDNFVGFVYDAGVQAKCERDLNYIIDAAQYDLVFGTNYNAITAGLAYQRENAVNVEQNQLIQTTEALKFARDQVAVALADGSTSETRAIAAFNKVIDLLNSNPVSTLLVFPDPAVPSIDNTAAKNALVANRANIQAAVSTYLQTNYNAVWTGLGIAGQAKCTRDVGYIVDALCYDIMYGGNTAAIRNADAYFVGITNQLGLDSNEVTATLAAYEELKNIVSGFIANPALDSTTDALIEIIRAHITNGGTTDFNAIRVNPTIAAEPALADFNAVDAIQSTVVTDTTQFILDNFDGFSYNSSACSRDVGYIVDALCYDIMYGGNSAAVRNAEAYFVGTTSQLGVGESFVTVLSYAKLITDINAIVTTPAEQARVVELVGIISDVITAGNLTGLPVVVYPAATSADFTAIQTNKATIVANTSVWLASTFNSFVYDSVKCSRDVGLIIDALVYDVTYRGNLETLVAARSYYVGVTNTPQYGLREKIPTIYAYKYLRTYISQLLVGAGVSPTFEQARINEIISTLENDGTLPAEIAPETAWVDSGILASFNELQLYRADIQEGVVDYINENYSGFQYNQTKCERDLGYIIDALTYDLLYGGNSQTYAAALTYYIGVASIVPNQEPQTAAAYEYLKGLVVDLVDGTSLNASIKLGSLLDIVVDFVADGATSATSIAPTYTFGANYSSQNQYRETILAREQVIKDAVILFLGTGRFNVDRCRRDTELILNAIIYDMMYSGNSQSKHAAQVYYDGGKLQNKQDEKQATVGAYAYMDLVLRKVVQANYVNRLQTRVDQNVDLAPATEAEVTRIKELTDVLTDVIANGYTCLLTLDAKFKISVPINTTMSFHQLSIITAAGHTMEWIGAGTDINAALPYNGGTPIIENEVITERGGVVYYTSTNQKGDFRIGEDLTIERDSGNIVGRAFSKSLLAVITPYILALEGG